MARKKISLIGAEARMKIIAGANYLADAVKLTLGPSGRNFASGVRGGAIQISNDGVSLAKEIQGKDEFEDIGVRAVREAATKTNDKVGDGTTTAVVLTQAILKALDFDKDVIGANPVRMVQQVKEESDVVVEKLNAMARPVIARDMLIDVAKVSVENEDLAKLVGGAQWDVGPSGTVLSEEHNDVSDKVEFIYGVRIDNGLGAGRIANNQEKQALELKNVRVLVTNKVFNTADEIRKLNGLIETLIKEGMKELVIIARAFDDTAVGLCVKNIQNFYEGKGGFPLYPVNAPYEDMDEVMGDLAATLGGKYIQTTERNMESVLSADVGVASQVFVKRYEGIITGKTPGKDARIDDLVVARSNHIIESLKGQISPFEKRRLEARLAQLTTGTAIVKVGAETEQERRYKKDKVDDAVNSVKAALQEGVVPGGGMALKMIADEMDSQDSGPDATLRLLPPALREPYLQIMKNAGGEFEIPTWVQDPVKVVRTAFEKASSIARSLATTEIVVNWEDEKPMWPGQVNTAANDED